MGDLIAKASSPARRGRGGGAAGALAASTQPVKLHLVRSDAKAVLARHQFLERLDSIVFELDDPAALGADQMVVMMAPERSLVARLAIAKVAGVSQSTFAQQLHRPIYRGHRDLGILLANLGPHILYRQVPPHGEEPLQDQRSLTGVLQTALGHVAIQDGILGPGLTHRNFSPQALIARASSGAPRSRPLSKTSDRWASSRTRASGSLRARTNREPYFA